MKILAVICLTCALVVIGECQDMTSMMFQAMGMDPPPLPPVMPQTLREHLYPRNRQQDYIRQKQFQQQFQQQKQRYLAYLAAQQQRQAKVNPYNAPYSTSSRLQPSDNSVFSPANKIRQPGAINSAASAKGNPYSAPYQVTSTKKGNLGNPYSVPRAATSGISAIRNKARYAIPAQTAKILKTMQTMKAMRDQSRKITDAKAAGCKLPVDNTAATVLLFNDCKNPASRMVCQAEFMNCVNIGMTPMCCPYGMNRLAMDTMSYVNKLQHYISEMA